MGVLFFFFFFQAEDGIRDWSVTGVQTCALPIYAEPKKKKEKERTKEKERKKERKTAENKNRKEKNKIGRASCRERV